MEEPPLVPGQFWPLLGLCPQLQTKELVKKGSKVYGHASLNVPDLV